MVGIIIWIVCGIVAGFIASKVMNGSGSGLIVDLIFGIIGAVVGGFLFDLLGVSINLPYYLGDIITAAVGAIVVLWIWKLIRK